MTAIPLTRSALAARTGATAQRPPVRIVHIGLGRFFRAHQAWYTAHAADAPQWGIAAFTGRSPVMADVLNHQDGLYSLVVRGEVSDEVEIITSVSEVHPGADTARLVQLISDPSVAIVTLTITESGYRMRADGSLDLADAELAADLATIRGDADHEPTTAVGRLLTGLDARRRGNAGPIAIVCCDNIPSNGEWLERGLTSAAGLLDPALAEWISTDVSFVSTSVDRITPALDADESAAMGAGWRDAAPVVTEHFSDWVLSGRFPAGRPEWESAGAHFVDDIEPWEQRKLWLLNGAHTLLAVTGQLKSLETVDQAIADADCRARVEAFWDEAVRALPDAVEHHAYRQELVSRFANPRIVHRLEQIAGETTVKVQYRLAAVAERSIAAGREPTASAAAIAAWIDWVVARPTAPDTRSSQLAVAAASTDPVCALVSVVSEQLGNDGTFIELVRSSRRPTAAAPAAHEHVRH